MWDKEVNKKSLILNTSDNLFIIDQYDIEEVGMMQFVSPFRIWTNTNTKELVFESENEVCILLNALVYEHGILTFTLFKSLANNRRAFLKLKINPSRKMYKFENDQGWTVINKSL